jgi:3'-5' exonuclease
MWVDRPEQLQYAVSLLQQSLVVAIDAEFTQVRSHAQGDVLTNTPRLALLQLAIDNYCFVVDTLRLHDLSPLAAVVENPEIIILLHGAGADLRVMAERGLTVAHYYDLEATSRAIFGQNESSLAAMLLRAFNIRLDKSLQRTDWTRRPLPPAMIAYAARDAEMTLALYHWLKQHYAWALPLYEGSSQQDTEPVAPWIEPFLRGTAPTPADVVVAEAIEQGTIADKEQVYADCRAALAALTHPARRSRLLRLIADLSLVQMVPEIEPLLQVPTADERAAAIRTLSRLAGAQSKERIRPLLQDPVQEVRKAAQIALRTGNKEPHGAWKAPSRGSDGTRSWTVGEAGDAESTASESDWKTRLRSIQDSLGQPGTEPDQP